MNKSILIISPTPSHPQNAGNRARIFSFVQVLKQIGIEIHFLYVKMEDEVNTEMIQYWGNNLHIVSTAKTTDSPKSKTLFEKVLHKTGLLNREKYKYNYHIDDWFDNNLLNYCIELNLKYTFDIVLTEYVFMSKALTVFPKNTLKIIDTHDCFTDRYQIFPLDSFGNRTSKWFSTYKSEEKKGLNRADTIIAIQKNEEVFFKTLIQKPIVTVGHLIEPDPLENNIFTQNILFFGSSNPINVDAYYFFIKNVWPKIKSSLPECKFIVAGLICNVIEKFDGVEYIGEVSDKKDAYTNVSVSVNPMTYGSGLKIKTLEALIYGIPVVSTSHGAIGLEEMIDKCIFVADEPELLSNHLINILLHEKSYKKIQHNIKESLQLYINSNMNNLKQLMN